MLTSDTGLTVSLHCFRATQLGRESNYSLGGIGAGVVPMPIINLGGIGAGVVPIPIANLGGIGAGVVPIPATLLRIVTLLNTTNNASINAKK